MALSKASKSILKVKSESRSDVFDSLQPMDGRPPGSSVHGILRQEHWSGLPFENQGRSSNFEKILAQIHVLIFESLSERQARSGAHPGT